MLVSVIVPIYNVGEYLGECLRGIGDQIHRDLDVILVDDGSTDDSFAIADGFARGDSRFRLVHQTNSGLVSAWKAGLLLAVGDYVCFVDGDDSITPDYVSRMVAAMLGHGADVVCGQAIRLRAGGERVPHRLVSLSSGRYHADDLHPSMVSSPRVGERTIAHCRVGKLMRTDLVLEQARNVPDSLTLGEDQVLIVAVLLASAVVAVDGDAWTYIYRQHMNSMTVRYTPSYWPRRMLAMECLERVVRGAGDYDFGQQLATEMVYCALASINNEQKSSLGFLEVWASLNVMLGDPRVRTAARAVALRNVARGKRVSALLLRLGLVSPLSLWVVTQGVGRRARQRVLVALRDRGTVGRCLR